MSTQDTLTGPDGRPYAIRLTRDEVAGIVRHFHWIPACRGYLRAYVQENHPGWDANEFAAVFRSARILVDSSVGGPPHPVRWLTAIWVSAGLGWCVESTRRHASVVSSRND